MGQGAGPVNLGSAYGDLLIDTSKLEGSLNQAFSQIERRAESVFSRMGDRVQAAGDRISGVGVSVTKLTAPIAAFGVASIKVFGKFDDALAEIQARTGATGEEMDKVRDKAIEMGKTTSFSATQSAEAMLQLLSSGYDLNETFAALPATLDAAAAGGMDLGYTADVITDALAMYNLGAESAERVADALARGAAASSAEINDLAQGLGNVGPIAAQFGLSIEDTVAILAAFSERGIKGAEAGTQLRSVLNNLSKPSEAVTGALNELGVELYDIEGNVRPLNDVFNDLRVAMAGLTEQERIEYVKTLGGAYGQLGLSVLTSTDAMGDMNALMADQADAATVADARMNSLNGKIQRVSSSIQTMMIETVGPAIDKYLKPFLDKVVDVITNITLWAQANPELTEKIVLLGAALVGLGPTLFAVGKAVKLVGAAIGMLGAAGPVGLAIAAVAALYVAYKKNFLGIRDFIEPVVKTIGGIFETFSEAFSEKGFWGALNTLFSEDTGLRLFTMFRSFGIGEGVAQKLADAFINVGRGLTEVLRVGNTVLGIFLKDGLSQALRSLFGGSMIQGIFEAFGMDEGLAEKLSGGIRTAFEAVVEVIDALAPRLKGIWDALKARDLNGVLEQVIALAGDIVAEIGKQLPLIVAKLAEWGQAFLDWIGPKIEPLLKELGDLALDVLKWIGDQAVSLGEKLVEWADEFIDWVVPAAKDLLKELPDLAKDVIEWIGEKATDIGEKLLEWGGEFVDWVVPAATDLLAKLPGLALDVYQWITEQSTTIGEKLLTWATEFVAWLGPATRDILPKLGTFLGEILSWILGTGVPKLVVGVVGLTAALIGFVAKAAVEILPELLKFIFAVGRYIITDLVPSIAQFAWNLGKGVIQGMLNGLVGIGRELWNLIKGELPTLEDVRNFITGGQDTFAPRTGSAMSQGGSSYMWSTDPYGSPQFFHSAGGTWRIGQYQRGGYTGDGPLNMLAGLVHRGEYVIPANGVPVLRESGSSLPPITVQITDAVMLRHPNAQQYGEELALGIQYKLRHAGGGIVSG